MVARRFPAEWEAQRAVWIGWPHEETDWPGKFETIPWVYAEIVRALAAVQMVEILCHSEELRESARACLQAAGVPVGRYRLHYIPNNRGWLRDCAPTAVKNESGKTEWVSWNFNAWAKYSNFNLDTEVPAAISQITQLPLVQALRPDNAKPMVLEGGAIETDGEGTVLVTEECLLSKIQERNPGMSRADYEKAFEKYLGCGKTIWLNKGIEGDDTHGHIDDVARFAGPAHVLLAYEDDSSLPNNEISRDNFERLSKVKDAKGRVLRVTKLPMPKPLYFNEQLLPASYANFYIANGLVLVPTFNDSADRLALNIIAEVFPNHKVQGLCCVDLILGLGTLHCLSQQEPS